MSSDSHPEFDESNPSDEELAPNPMDPAKTWVPLERDSKFLPETSDFPGPPAETEAGSLGELSDSDADSEDGQDLPDDVEPPPQFGEYELLERVGGGGMGNVYKAHHKRLDRIVALKTLRSGTARVERQLERFIREAKAAARLDHPNIVPCYEFGEHQGWHYLTMAFVKGESLHHRLVKGPMQPREAALMIQSLAGAVAHAHQQGVIHRDIKPGNVILGDDGRPRLTDFGIAKLIDMTDPPIASTQLTLVGQALGTPGYMAPEQSAGRRWEIGPAVDIYALGGLLTAALTGRPANGDTPATLSGDVPVGLRTICDRCLAYRPLDRYESAEDLLSDLNAYLHGADLGAHPPHAATKEEMPTSPESATKFPKRNLLLMVAFILAVLICSFLLATWFTSGWRNPDLGPENLTPQGKPASAGAFSATGSAGSGGETSRRAVQSHLQILVQQDDGKITEIERLEGGKLPASPTLFADIKLDRADNASLYLISIDTMGQVSLINEKPLDLAPNGSQKTHDPEYLPEAEHFLIQGETADFHRIPHSGPEGMLTCVLLSRKTPASDEIIEQWKTRFDSLKSTPLPAPSAAAKGRFTVRDGELRPRTTPDPLGKDHPLRGLLDEVLNPLHEAADAIEVVTFAVPAHSSEEMP